MGSGLPERALRLCSSPESTAVPAAGSSPGLPKSDLDLGLRSSTKLASALPPLATATKPAALPTLRRVGMQP